LKKDTVFALRMAKTVREALNEAAKKDCRSVSSMLDKIITDYLIKRGFLEEPGAFKERRMYPRKSVAIPAKATTKTGMESESFQSIVLDISMGGVKVLYPKGTEIKFTSKEDLPHFQLSFEPPFVDEEIGFNCGTCHMMNTGGGSLVGAAFINPEGTSLQKLSKYIM